jgi:hypothetical protein
MSSEKENNNWIYVSILKTLEPKIPVSSKLDIENFWGILRFDVSTEEGWDLHNEVFDYCSANNIEVTKSGIEYWNDLNRWDLSSIRLKNNFRTWVIDTPFAIEVLISSLVSAEQMTSEVEYYL